MTNQTPIERAGEALRADNCPCETACYCSEWHREAHLAFESIDTDELAKVVRRHRRNRAVNFGRDYACLCGEVLRSNSHHVQTDHVAQAVKNWLTGKVIQQ